MNADLKIADIIRCDVLIVGGGGAGLRCAAEIMEKKPGAEIYAVTKVAHVQKSHTTAAQGGVAAVDPRDSSDSNEFHMFDTWKGSDCMADQVVVRQVVESAWEQVLWLENHGMHFSRDENGRMARRTFGGHTINFGKGTSYRVKFEADRTGKGIMDTGWWESLKAGVKYINQSLATELIIEGGKCLGAVVFEAKKGRFIAVLAKATIVSTGGLGQVFKVTSNCRGNTGDGTALALAAGLPVMDMEAVQFHPTGIVGPGILASEALRGEGGILRNKDGEPFMEKYAPAHKDLAPRDIVSRSIETEIREGRGVLNPDHNIWHVWIDIRHLPDYVHDVKLPEISGFFKRFVNIDPKKELAPVCPTAHYQMGGIPTDRWGRVQADEDSFVDGLFAMGECAAASLHGFNRLGTNSLLELITMGKIVGEKTLEWLGDSQSTGAHQQPLNLGEATMARFSSYLEGGENNHLGQIREEMRKVMTDNVGVFRTEEGISEAVEKLKELKDRADKITLSDRGLIMNQELVERWEMDNMLANAMVIAQGALERKESRGGHAREDYPDRSDDYNYHTLAWMEDYGEIKWGKREIDRCIFEEKSCSYVEGFDFIERKY